MSWQTIKVTFSELNLDLKEIYLNLGYGGAEPEKHIKVMVQSMIQDISEFCRPVVGFGMYEGYCNNDKFVIINNQYIKVGQVITKYLQNCSQFAVFLVTAGLEFDEYCSRLKAEADILSEFIAYSIGSEIAEAAVRFVSEKIAAEATVKNMGYTHSYSPGYCSWHVREQENLFKVMPNNPCGVILNKSNLMFPEKSVSGIIGLGKNIKPTAHSCEICGMVNCYKRKR